MKYICRKSHGSDCHLRFLLRRSAAKAHRRLTFPAFSRQWLPTDISFFTANCKQLALLPVTQQQKNPKKVMSAFHLLSSLKGPNWDGISLGCDKHRTLYCMYTSWQSSSKPRSGKGTQTDSSVSMRHPCQKTCESTVEMASRQNTIRDQASHSRKQQTARPHSVH